MEFVEWLDVDGKHWFALLAAVTSSLLAIYIALRSPRNVFSRILFLFMVCVAEWNALEFVERRAVTRPEGIDE